LGLNYNIFSPKVKLFLENTVFRQLFSGFLLFFYVNFKTQICGHLTAHSTTSCEKIRKCLHNHSIMRNRFMVTGSDIMKTVFPFFPKQGLTFAHICDKKIFLLVKENLFLCEGRKKIFICIEF